MKNIKSITKNDRPRERLAVSGPSTLKDEELLVILLGSGSKSAGVHVLASRVLATLNERNGNLELSDLTRIEGIGSAKATMLLAAQEFFRRRIRPRGIKVTAPADVIPLLAHWARQPQEHFIAVTLNGANEVLHNRVITIGIANASQIHPREVFVDAIKDRACSVILAHNHPSGDLTPSEADKEVTQRLVQAGAVLGIKVLDHVIVSERGHFSFKERGLLGS